jgi:TPR repeat protein
MYGVDSLADATPDPSLERYGYHCLPQHQLELLDDIEARFERGDRLRLGLKVLMEEDRGWAEIIATAKLGHPVALGLCLLFGKGVEKNQELAVEILKPSSDRGHATAQFGLGYCYHMGEGVRFNGDEAFRLYKLSAEQNHATAQNNLGVCFFNGIGTYIDKPAALAWFERAAREKQSMAQCWMGWYCAHEKQNEKEAIYWYRLSAYQNNPSGLSNLSMCYSTGSGVALNNRMLEALRQISSRSFSSVISALNVHFC